MRHRHLVSSALEVPRPTVGDRTAARAGPAFGRKEGRGSTRGSRHECGARRRGTRCE